MCHLAVAAAPVALIGIVNLHQAGELASGLALEHRLCDSALDQIGKQRLHHRGVLGVPRLDTQQVLGSCRIQTHGPRRSSVRRCGEGEFSIQVMMPDYRGCKTDALNCGSNRAGRIC